MCSSDLESFLRDAGGLSKSEAVSFIARIKSMQGRSDSDEQDEIREALEKLSESFR